MSSRNRLSNVMKGPAGGPDMMVKEVSPTIVPFDVDDSDVDGSQKLDHMGCNVYDNKDMARMGRSQQMRRVFRQFSLISFTAICMGTWEFVLLANTQGLVSGGRAGLFWSYIWTLVGYAFITASLAEMASMAPTAGGQYHWVSEFAPPSMQRGLSYCAGWLGFLCWQSGNASGAFLVGTLIQGLLVIKNPDYAAPGWQGFLLVIPVVICCLALNIWATHYLPTMQNVFMFIHVFGFVAIVVCLWVLGPHVDAHTALLEFTNEGGWQTTGLALMVGQITCVSALGASDSAAHMAEEVRDAGLTVPNAIITTFSVNAFLGFIMMISFVFCVPSIDDAINDPTGYPILYVLQLSMPVYGTICVIVLMMVLMQVSNISYQASTARTTFAFARDGGMPFSKWIGHIHPTLQIPVNAVIVSAVITILLAAVYIGSADAYNAIISLNGSAMMGTYGISITCVLYRRLTSPHLLPPCRFSLGNWGVVVNSIGAAYAWVIFFWSFWPNAIPVTAPTMNYAIVMFGGSVVIAMFYYVFTARHHYVGPVERTEGWKERRETMS